MFHGKLNTHRKLVRNLSMDIIVSGLFLDFSRTSQLVPTQMKLTGDASTNLAS